MKRLLIAGIGSTQPGDDLGWQALDTLQASGFCLPGHHIEWRRIEHPAVDLLPAIAEQDAAVLLDALLEPGQAGQSCVRVLRWDELRPAERGCSSHGFSVAETLALAAQLDRLPERLSILGLQGPLDGLRPLLQRQLRDAVLAPA